MKKVFTLQQAHIFLKKLHNEKKKIVLVGGCFDIVHIGHIIFLEKSKARGDVLVVMLENDTTIRERKGIQRPIHTQKQRAHILSDLIMVDVVVLLPHVLTNKAYDQTVQKLFPDIIAATRGDAGAKHKKRQAKQLGIQFAYVTNKVKSFSTTILLQTLAKEE